jgi:hypothetical protein
MKVRLYHNNSTSHHLLDIARSNFGYLYNGFMCGCMPQGNNSQPRKVASKPLPELEYVPIDDSYISTRQFRAKLQQAKKPKSEPYI